MLFYSTLSYAVDYPKIRYKTSTDSTIVIIEPVKKVEYNYTLVDKPLRLYVDIKVDLDKNYKAVKIPINDTRVLKVRTGSPVKGVFRTVLDLDTGFDTYNVYTLKTPFRIVVNISKTLDPKTKGKKKAKPPKTSQPISYLPNQSFFASTSTGSFINVSGNVDVLRNGRLPAINAKEGIVLFVGDLVRVKKSSIAKIIIDVATAITIGGTSRVKFADGDSGGSDCNVELTKGRLEVDSTSNKVKTVATKTPAIIAAHKDARFYLFYNNGDTEILVREGSVEVFNPDISGKNKAVKVEAGNATVVRKGKAPFTPRIVIEAEIKAFEAQFSNTKF